MFHRLSWRTSHHLLRRLSLKSIQGKLEAMTSSLAKEITSAQAKRGHQGSKEEITKLAGDYAEKWLSFSKSYDWIASTTIEPCHSDVSEQRALQAVEGALNVVRILVGERDAPSVHSAYSPTNITHSALLTTEDDGSTNVVVSQSFGLHSKNPEWFDMLAERAPVFFAAAEEVLGAIKVPEVMPPLAQRFLEASAWYGEATRELNLAMRLVKYVIAIERMVLTSEGSRIRNVFACRAAILCNHRSSGGLVDWEQKLKELYAFRSHISHGKASIFDERMELMVGRAQVAARLVLFSGLHLYKQLALLEPEYSVKELKQAYTVLERRYFKGENR